MKILVQVTLYDDETGDVKEQIIDTYGSRYSIGYEIENLFRRLGERLAKKLDPNYDS